MRFAFIGIGALGSYFGGRLAQAGNDVVFIARGKTLEALRQNGLRVESTLGDVSLPQVRATDKPSEAGPVDVVFVTVKAWQVPETARQIRPLVGPETTVVPLQNGVEAYDQLVAVLGPGVVLGGSAQIIAFITEPGVVRHIGMKPLMTIGEWNNARPPRLENLVACLKAAGIAVRVPEDIRLALWDKFMYIASLAGVGAVTHAPVGIVRTVPEARSLLQRALEEIAGVANAHGVALSDESIAKALKQIDTLPPEGTASMQRDIAAGKPSELEALNGAAVRLGREKGIRTAVHDFIYSALLPMEMRARGQVRF